MGLSLYELTDQFLALEELALDPDTDTQLIEDTLAALDGEIEVKMENYGKLIRNIEVLTEKVEEEKKRLADYFIHDYYEIRDNTYERCRRH